MEYSSRIFVPNISAEYFRGNAIKKKGKSGQLTTLAPPNHHETDKINEILNVSVCHRLLVLNLLVIT